jgi:hypothetical protein
MTVSSQRGDQAILGRQPACQANAGAISPDDPRLGTQRSGRSSRKNPREQDYRRCAREGRAVRHATRRDETWPATAGSGEGFLRSNSTLRAGSRKPCCYRETSGWGAQNPTTARFSASPSRPDITTAILEGDASRPDCDDPDRAPPPAELAGAASRTRFRLSRGRDQIAIAAPWGPVCIAANLSLRQFVTSGAMPIHRVSPVHQSPTEIFRSCGVSAAASRCMDELRVFTRRPAGELGHPNSTEIRFVVILSSAGHWCCRQAVIPASAANSKKSLITILSAVGCLCSCSGRGWAPGRSTCRRDTAGCN